jgi:hypothetical protein
MFIYFTDNLNVIINVSAVLPPENGSSANTEDEYAFEMILTANLMAAVRYSS